MVTKIYIQRFHLEYIFGIKINVGSYYTFVQNDLCTMTYSV